MMNIIWIHYTCKLHLLLELGCQWVNLKSKTLYTDNCTYAFNVEVSFVLI